MGASPDSIKMAATPSPNPNGMSAYSSPVSKEQEANIQAVPSPKSEKVGVDTPLYSNKPNGKKQAPKKQAAKKQAVGFSQVPRRSGREKLGRTTR